MADNKALHRAAKAQQDEFYTQTFDIENELRYYWDHFRGKKILCNCDDPYESNFFKYFAIRFNLLNLAKLTATCYSGSPIAHSQLTFNFDEDSQAPAKTPYCAEITEFKDYNGDTAEDLQDIEFILEHNVGGGVRKLQGDGDFRSQECIELLKESDVVVTNPPFSLLREFIALLMKYEKKFVIIGNVNAITYKEIFPLFMQNKMWLGRGFRKGNAYFSLPSIADPSRYKDYNPETGLVSMRNCCWFTNLDHGWRHHDIILYKSYEREPELYPHYDNYDAIEVSKVDFIPEDYYGVMGVPITFMGKYNPEQFEIVSFRKGNDGKDLVYTNKDGKKVYPYMRILIRRKNNPA